MRFRPERGEVRLLVLSALAAGPSHGYQIIQSIEQQTGGAYKPSPGTIYPTLQMLEELGLVAIEAEEGKRKRYVLTDEGRDELEAHADDVRDAFDRLGGDSGDWHERLDFHGWKKRLRRVMRTVAREARRGRVEPERLERIKGVVDDAIDRIEAILDGDE